MLHKAGERVDYVVTHLEMTARPGYPRPHAPAGAPAALIPADGPPVGLPLERRSVSLRREKVTPVMFRLNIPCLYIGSLTSTATVLRKIRKQPRHSASIGATTE